MSSIWTVRRSAADAKLAGLCGGVARHWNVDPVLIRVAWALLALSGGVGVVLYIAGWLLIPLDHKPQAPVADLFGETVRRWPRELWVTLVAIACVAVFLASSEVAPFSFGPALVIAGIWYFGFYKPRQAKRSDSPPPPSAVPPPPSFVRYPGPPTPFTEAAEAWQRRVHQVHGHDARASWPTTPPFAAPAGPSATPRPYQPPHAPVTWQTVPPRAPMPAQAGPWPPAPASRGAFSDPGLTDEARAEWDRAGYLSMPDPVGLYDDAASVAPPIKRADLPSAKRLRLVFVIMMGLALSTLAILDASGIAVPVEAYFALPLLLTGLALIAATWLGRARGLLPIGVLLAVAVLVSSIVPALPDVAASSAAPVTRVHSSASELAAGDAVDVGQLSIDLSRLTLDADATYSARVGAGELRLVLPPDLPVVVNYSNGFGSTQILNRTTTVRTEDSGQLSDPPMGHGEPTLTLDVSIDVGHLVVVRR